MKYLSYLAFLTLLFACSLTSEKEFMAYERVDKEEVASGMPNFYLMEHQFSKTSRAPASAKKSHLSHVSNRKLYFLTLYSQHLWFSEVLSRENELNYCPSFHHEVVSHSQKITSMRALYSGAYLKEQKIEQIDSRSLAYFPEYALQVDGSREVADVSESYVKDFMKRGLNRHYEKNLHELKELCETGRSDNYYIFENLSRHLNDHPEFHASHDALKALLKTPIFANMLLFQSMLGDRIALPQAINSFPFNVYNDFEEEVVSRTRVNWIKGYFVALKSKRASQVARYRVK